jgi:putative Mg2+ transporter-C (MgtC) family protein
MVIRTRMDGVMRLDSRIHRPGPDRRTAVEQLFGDPALSWLAAAKLVGAIVLALPTAWDREVHSRIMGLRTFPLVSLGACSYVLISVEFLGADNPESMARILQGLMTGIGFIGGGAILKNDDRVFGTTSAASIWITGAVGGAVGLGYWGIAAMLAALNFAVIFVFGRIQQRLDDAKPKDPS